MSFNAGGSNADGLDDDLENGERLREEGNQLEALGDEGGEGDTAELQELAPEQVSNTDDYFGSQALGLDRQESEADILQLRNEGTPPLDNVDEGVLSEAPATPAAQRYLLESPGGSASIPDDTPSQQGSRLSSPGPSASPLPRKHAMRTASGALLPFERRFEARLTSSPSPSPRTGSPAFLSPHSRQISLSSQFSQISSQDGGESDNVPQAPWDVVRWTKLRKLTGQVFSEIGKRNFGRPTCLAISALIAIGTTKGFVLGFDYHQTLKIIMGPGTKAAECGSVTALGIAADYSTIASGHANGYIFTWEINRPARPFLTIPPLEKAMLRQAHHPDGHLSDCAILHIGFLGTRHTALVSADSGGMAFSHLASRGLGPVTRTMHTTRLLGRYPQPDPQTERARKPSSVLAFSSLPLGNVEQSTDRMGLTALLTPYLLVVVSTTPNAQTQHKSVRPKEVTPHSTLSGCLAWFPAVKLKSTSRDSDKEVSECKLVYCWSNVLSILEIKVLDDADDPQRPPKLEFITRSRWRAEEAIVAVQWLSRSVLGVLTISQRLLIIEDSSLQVTDSLDLLHRHIYHQDLFSRQLHAVVEQLNPEDPSMHGVVADAFYMSFRAYKGRLFLLSFNDLTLGTLSNWADRLVALMEAGDHVAALRLATQYYSGSANNVTIGLPDSDTARHDMVRERLVDMMSASLQYTISQQDEARDKRLRETAEVCFEACVTMHETDYLFDHVFECYQDADVEALFINALEPYVLDGDLIQIPPEVVKSLVSHFISQDQGSRLEELLCRLEPQSFDLDQMTALCRQHGLYDALIYVWTQAIRDYVTPLIELLRLVKMLNAGEAGEDLADTPYFGSAMKVFPFLAFSLTGRRYPSGEFMDDDEALHARADLYEFLFSGRAVAWPAGSSKVFLYSNSAQDEPAFPYLTLLLGFDAASFMTMLNEAFEDPFLNEADEDSSINSTVHVNGLANRPGYKMTRQHIISIMLDVMRQNNSEPEDTVYLDIFIARNLPKYSTQLVLSGSLLNNVLQRLCRPPSPLLHEDCQLSAEYLLSAYQPPDVSSVIQDLRRARFYRVMKTIYRRQRLFVDLFEAYFEDPDDREDVFGFITFCFRNPSEIGPRQSQAIRSAVVVHANDLAEVDAIKTARTLAMSDLKLLQPVADALQDSYLCFLFLRTLFEPGLLRDGSLSTPFRDLPEDERASFQEHYVQLMCAHEPGHVADYVGLLQSGDLRLEEVLPALENSGVVDAAVVLLARDGLATDAMDRLVSHMRSLQQTLISLLIGASESPDVVSTREAADGLVEDVEKYTKIGIWLCRGQSANARRRPRPRTNFAWDISENDLDLDEFLWLILVDVVVQLTKNVSLVVQQIENRTVERSVESINPETLRSSLRSNVQQAFTALLAATAAPSSKQQPSVHHQSAPPASDHLSFLRVLRAFLTRAATTAPSLSDLRDVLADIFSAYTFEQGVLNLANDLLGSDVFADIQKAHELRQRGWRPRTQVCERCKRRAWGPGIGEMVWDEWVAKEGERQVTRARKAVERGGGEEAKRLERGKERARAAVTPITTSFDEDRDEARRKLTLLVFACRHVFHRVCLDEAYRDGQPARPGGYKCPLCTGTESM